MNAPLPTLENAERSRLPRPVPPEAVSTRERIRGAALIVLGSFIAATLVLGLVDLAPSIARGTLIVAGSSTTHPVVIRLLALGVLAGLSFIAAGVQLWRRGRLGGTTATFLALVVAVAVTHLWIARDRLL